MGACASLRSSLVDRTLEKKEKKEDDSTYSLAHSLARIVKVSSPPRWTKTGEIEGWCSAL